MGEAPPWSLRSHWLRLPRLEESEPRAWDCVVLGSGGAACFAALELARNGAAVALVVDQPQADRLLRLPGVSLPCLTEHYWSVVESIGRDETRGWWQLAAEGSQALRQCLAEAAPAGSFQEGSALLVAANPIECKEMTRGLRWMREDGIEAKMIGTTTVESYAPIAESEGALVLPGAAVFQPATWHDLLWTVLAQAGVACFRSERHWGLRPEPLGLICSDRAIDCESLVLANGFASLTLLQVQKPWIFPLRGQCLLSRPVSQGLRSSVVAMLANRGHELYRDWDGCFLAAGIHPDAGALEMTDELQVDPTFCERLHEVARRRIPEMRTLGYSQRWPAVYEYSMDGLPLVGTAPGQHRVWLAAGFAGFEWSLGAGAGLHVGRALAEKPNALRALPSASPRRF